MAAVQMATIKLLTIKLLWQPDADIKRAAG
jgi:hypothetical protein